MSQGLIGSRTPACCRVDWLYQIAPVRTTGGRRIKAANLVDKALISRKFSAAALAPMNALPISAPPAPTDLGRALFSRTISDHWLEKKRPPPPATRSGGGQTTANHRNLRQNSHIGRTLVRAGEG